MQLRFARSRFFVGFIDHALQLRIPPLPVRFGFRLSGGCKAYLADRPDAYAGDLVELFDQPVYRADHAVHHGIHDRQHLHLGIVKSVCDPKADAGKKDWNLIKKAQYAVPDADHTRTEIRVGFP